MSAREETLGAEHAETFHSVNDLAVALREQGKLDEAEPCYNRYNRYNQPLQPLQVEPTGRGRALLQPLQAEPLYRRKLQRQQTQQGKGHKHTLGTANNLASLLSEQV